MQMEWCKKAFIGVCGCLLLGGFASNVFAGTRQMENLSRGLASSNVGTGMLVSWRLLGTDDPATEFNLYRDGEKIASIGKTEGTNYFDKDGSATSKYTVSAVVNGKEGPKSGLSLVYDKTVADNGKNFPYKQLTLKAPADMTMPNGEVATYTPSDMSTGDLDGDGEYELVVKWDPSNAHDNSQTGYTGNTYLDAYKLDGSFMWRIDLGVNIRSGAHYTQFQVFDYDGDGKAEMIVKTADGTIDGTGKAIGDKSANYRSEAGTILDGPEYLTVFRGSDGGQITTIDYVPPRNILKSAKDVHDAGYWGDNYGNRSERYIAATAYLDGVHPSAIFIRGYYSASYVVAYDFDGKTLKQRWFHKSETPGQGLYEQGNHNIVTGDIDGDGYDEIIFGGAALNHDGTLRYSTGLGHGDAGHLGDLDPNLPGLEFFDVHEHTDAKYTDELRAPDGTILWGGAQQGKDNGRGIAADIDSTHRGYEIWSAKGGGLHTIKGEVLGTPSLSMNFRIYFDGGVYDDLLDGAYITKYDPSAMKANVYFDGGAALGAVGCNGTKNTPNLVADITGDFREELIVHNSTDPSIVYIISTPVESPNRVYTLMHDAVYRTAIAWQNTAYNQPPHLGYYLPDMIKNLKKPDIFVVGEGAPVSEEDSTPSFTDGKSELDAAVADTGLGWTEKTNAGYTGEGYFNFEASSSAYATWEIFSQKDGKTTLTIRFANGGPAARDMVLVINGVSVGTVNFPATGAWTTYQDATIDVKISAGVNTVTLVTLTSDGPNVDAFTFAMDGIERFDGTQKIDDETVISAKPIVFRSANYNIVTGEFRSLSAGLAEVNVYDLNGNLVQSVAQNVQAGISQVSIVREALSNGNFVAVVKLNGRAMSKIPFTNSIR